VPATHAGPPGSVAAARELSGLAILAIGSALLSVGASFAMPPMELLTSNSIGRSTWLFSINPAVVTIASLVLFVVFLIAAVSRWALAPATLYGAGVAVSGGGFLILALGGGSVAIYVVGAVIAALGEVVIPLGTAYAALAIRGRGAAIVIAVWMASASIMSLMSSPLAQVSRTGTLILTSLLCLGAGVMLALKGRQIHTTYFDTPPV
jgi:hypothetical protein